METHWVKPVALEVIVFDLVGTFTWRNGGGVGSTLEPISEDSLEGTITISPLKVAGKMIVLRDMLVLRKVYY